MLLRYLNLKWFNLNLFIKFIGGNMLFQMSILIADLFVLKFVDKDGVGIFQLTLLIQGYVIISRMGILNSFNREFVYVKAKGNLDEATKILQTTHAHVLFSMIIQGLAFLFFGVYYFFVELNSLFGWSMICMVFYTICEAGANFEEAKYRSELKFKEITTSKIVISITSILLLILPYKFGLIGLLIRIIILQYISYLFYRYYSPSKSFPKFHKAQWLKLFNDGWKFWAFSYVRGFIKTIPRLYLSLFSTLGLLALFTPVSWVLLSFTMLTTSLTTYLYPILSDQFARGMGKLQKQSLFINLIAFFVSIPFAVFGYFMIQPLVNYFLPEYSEAIIPMKITLIASLFDIITVTSTVWYSMKDWKSLTIFYGLNIIFTSICFAILHIYFMQNVLYEISIVILLSSILCASIVICQIFYNEYYVQKKTPILPI
jgi:O-antigen/teichoic acid export membrane protein